MGEHLAAHILKPKEVEFANEFLETENARRAAMKVYKINDISKGDNKAHNLLTKDTVRKYIEDQALGAATRITKLSKKSKNLMVKLAANKDILDRAGFKPQEAAVNINIPLYLPAEVMEKYNLNEQNG